MGKEINDKAMTKEQLLDKAIAVLRMVRDWDRSERNANRKGLRALLSFNVKEVLEDFDTQDAKYKNGDEVWILDRSDFCLVSCRVSWVYKNLSGINCYQLHELTGRNLGQLPEYYIFGTKEEAGKFWSEKLGSLAKTLLH